MLSNINASLAALFILLFASLTQEEEKELGYMAIAVLAGIIILAMIIHAVIGANRRKKR